MKSSRKEQHEYWKSLLELFFCDVEGGDLTLTSCRLSSFVGESCFDRVHKVAVLKTLFLLLAPGRSCRLREQVSGTSLTNSSCLSSDILVLSVVRFAPRRFAATLCFRQGRVAVTQAIFEHESYFCVSCCSGFYFYFYFC